MVAERSRGKIGSRKKSIRSHNQGDNQVKLKNQSIVVKAVQFNMEKKFQSVYYASRNFIQIYNSIWEVNTNIILKRQIRGLLA